MWALLQILNFMSQTPPRILVDQFWSKEESNYYLDSKKIKQLQDVVQSAKVTIQLTKTYYF